VSGYEVARALRAEGLGDVALVAVSGYAQAEDRDRALASGFDAHLPKTPSLERLRELLARLPARDRATGSS
jgi:CheY-like chemotaxis protein